MLMVSEDYANNVGNLLHTVGVVELTGVRACEDPHFIVL